MPQYAILPRYDYNVLRSKKPESLEEAPHTRQVLSALQRTFRIRIDKKAQQIQESLDTFL